MNVSDLRSTSSFPSISMPLESATSARRRWPVVARAVTIGSRRSESLQRGSTSLTRIIHDTSTAAHQRPNACFSLLIEVLHRLRGSNLAFGR